MSFLNNYSENQMAKTYYPWTTLQNVGDSFEINNTVGITHKRQLVYAANKSKKYGGAKFRHETITNSEGEKVLRVVRVA